MTRADTIHHSQRAPLSHACVCPCVCVPTKDQARFPSISCDQSLVTDRKEKPFIILCT